MGSRVRALGSVPAMTAMQVPPGAGAPEPSDDHGAWVARDEAVVWHGFTQMASYAENRPVIVERAEGRELIDVEGRVGLLVQVKRDRREAAVDQVLVDRVRRAADVGGDADLLRFEVVHELLVIGRDELSVVVR